MIMADPMYEEMAKMMKPGVRVVQGKDWGSERSHPDTFAVTGPGTVMSTYKSETYKNWWKVKWDACNIGDEWYYRMGVDGIYELKILDYMQEPTEKIDIVSWMFSTKKFYDFKIICSNKIFECHKVVISCQSDVFDAMFTNMNMTEGNSGEVKVDDIKADVMETMIYFMYNQKVLDAKQINEELLLAADKYNIANLVKLCCEQLKAKISLENALDILLTADLTNQEEPLKATSEFMRKNSGKLVKTSLWIEKEKTDLKLINDLYSKVFLSAD